MKFLLSDLPFWTDCISGKAPDECDYFVKHTGCKGCPETQIAQNEMADSIEYISAWIKATTAKVKNMEIPESMMDEMGSLLEEGDLQGVYSLLVGGTGDGIVDALEASAKALRRGR